MILSPDDVNDVAYWIIQTMNEIEAEEGKAALSGITERHLLHIITDVFFGEKYVNCFIHYLN